MRLADIELIGASLSWARRVISELASLAAVYTTLVTASLFVLVAALILLFSNFKHSSNRT